MSLQEPWLDKDDDDCEGPIIHCEHCGSAYATIVTIVTVLSDHTEYACPVCESVVWLDC